MLYREIIAVCSHIHTKHINTLCGQNVELLNVKNGGTCSDHWAINGQPAPKNSDVNKSVTIHFALHCQPLTNVRRSCHALNWSRCSEDSSPVYTAIRDVDASIAFPRDTASPSLSIILQAHASLYILAHGTTNCELHTATGKGHNSSPGCWSDNFNLTAVSLTIFLFYVPNIWKF